MAVWPAPWKHCMEEQRTKHENEIFYLQKKNQRLADTTKAQNKALNDTKEDRVSKMHRPQGLKKVHCVAVWRQWKGVPCGCVPRI